MAEESDLERTEEASPRRIEEARKKGQVARSRELSTFVVLMSGGGLLLITASTLMQQAFSLMREALKFGHALAFDPSLMVARLGDLSRHGLMALAPFLLAMLVASVAGSLALSGWLFSSEAFVPDFSRLNPMQGLSRLLSTKSLIELAKALIKAILIGGVAIAVIWHKRGDLFALAFESLPVATAHAGSLILTTFLLITGSMLLIVAIDVPFQLWDYGRQLRMTKEELKQEAKESEGDPHVKGRIRSMQRALARKRMMSEVPKADVVITNPTRFAVALRYEDGKMRAPQLLAKGRLLLAQRIREIAQENNIPLVEAPPLARALYQHVEPGKEIPTELYNAVAEVMVYVYRLRHYAAEGGVQPIMPQNVQVPVELDPEGKAHGE